MHSLFDCIIRHCRDVARRVSTYIAVNITPVTQGPWGNCVAVFCSLFFVPLFQSFNIWLFLPELVPIYWKGRTCPR